MTQEHAKMKICSFASSAIFSQFMTHVNKMLYNIYNLFMSHPLLVLPPTDEQMNRHSMLYNMLCLFIRPSV